MERGKVSFGVTYCRVLAAALVMTGALMAVPQAIGSAAASGGVGASRAVTGGASPVQMAGATTAPAAAVPFFAFYYLWWDPNHWQLKLGSSYPYTQSGPAIAMPLPAVLAADGCTGTPVYTGDTLLDVPAPSLNLYSQTVASTFDAHIQTAAAAGLQGFVVSWAGSGQTGQTPSSTAFSQRLDLLASRVALYNSTHSNKFHLILGYEGTDKTGGTRSVSWIQNDWAYFVKQYGSNPVFQVPQYGKKPVVMFLDSRLFTVAAIASIVSGFRTSLTIIGDEHGLASWNRGVAPYLDGTSWYWSSQDPINNPQSFSQIAALASTVQSQGKLWISPLSGGYNKGWFNRTGTCVPRRGGLTMQDNYAGNKASHPAGWFYISWNEFYENTYLEPSVRYGSTYLNYLKAIIANP